MIIKTEKIQYFDCVASFNTFTNVHNLEIINK